MASCRPSSCQEWLKRRWGWVVCAASFFIQLGMYSLAYSFSFLFVDIQRELNSTAVETGWIGSVMWGIQMFSSPVGSSLESCLNYRSAIILIIILSSLSVFVSAYAQSVQQLFITLGACYGITLGTAWFIMLCVMVQYFPGKNSVRAVSLATMGAATALLLVSKPVSMILEAFGWRQTLKLIAVFTLIISLPPAFLVFPPKVKEGIKIIRVSSDDEKDGTHQSSTSSQEKGSTGEYTKRGDGEHLQLDQADDVAYSLSIPSRWERWKMVISIDAFLYSVFTVTCSMLWSVFFVNIVSFYDSIGIDSNGSAGLLTITAISELATKVALATIGEISPFKKAYLLLCKVVMMIGLSLAMVFATTYPHFIVLSIVTGVLRACFNVLLWPCSIETFGGNCNDEVLAMTSVSRGIGFLTGTLPAGAIYDHLGSYRLSFLVVTGTATISTVALATVLIRQKMATGPSKKTKHVGQEGTVEEDVYLRVPLETAV